MEKRKRKCCVEACNSEEERSFHLFPRNVEMSVKWKEVINIKKDIGIKTKYLYVCGATSPTSVLKRRTKPERASGMDEIRVKERSKKARKLKQLGQFIA